MAAQEYTSVVQQLYISYFGRPADYYGLQNFSNALAALDTKGEYKTFAAVSAAVQADKAGTSALSKLVNSFNGSAESAALYGTGTSQIEIGKFVNAIYQNVLGRDADKSGFDFWVNAITSGTLTKANAAASISAAALTNTSAQGLLDAKTVQNKLAIATSFTNNLDTPVEITSYSGDAAAAAARSLLAAVNNGTDVTAYQADVTTSIENIVAVAVPGKTFELTTNIDNLIGTQGNDTFNAIISGTANPFGPLDVVDGGAGRDTLSIADTATAAGAAFALPNVAIKNIETLVVSTTGALGTSAASSFDISNTGVTSAVLTAAGSGDSFVKAANTANVTVTATTGAVSVAGGKAVTVTGTDVNTVSGTALTNVTVHGGSAVISNDTASTAAAGTTLTAVTLDGISGASTVAGKGVTTVNLQNITDTATTVDVTNGTTNGHALKVNLNAVDGVTLTDDTATSVAINAASDSAVTLVAAAATAATVAGAGAVELDVAGAADLTAVDASAAAGGLTLTGAAADLATITTGAGDDVVTIATLTVKDDTTVTTDTPVSATVDTGAGDDEITVATAGDGIVTVNAGAGNDTVNVTARSTGALNVNLGAGNDTFTTTGVQIGANDKIDAGDGKDMLSLSLVGSANVAAFSNFDAFDAAGLAKTLDVNILAAKNSVTEIVASGTVGTSAIHAAELINLGAGVTFRATADMGTADTLTLTQKTAGVLTVTVDADESGNADVGADVVSAKIAASNATSINAVFDTSYKASIDTEVTAANGDNVTTLQLSGAAATSVNVTSGGALSQNVLAYADTSTGTTGKLATLTITGDQHLSLSNTFAATNSGLATVDSSALKGGLTFSMVNLKDGGNVILGSGADLITVTSVSTTSAFETITGFEKAAATAVSTTADATSKAAVIADADQLILGSAVVANATTTNVGGDVNGKGVLTFSGSGPATLADAVSIANTAAETAGEALVFEYLGNTYVFVQGATDTLVQLAGITGVTNFAEVSTTGANADHFFIV